MRDSPLDFLASFASSFCSDDVSYPPLPFVAHSGRPNGRQARMGDSLARIGDDKISFCIVFSVLFAAAARMGDVRPEWATIFSKPVAHSGQSLFEDDWPEWANLGPNGLILARMDEIVSRTGDTGPNGRRPEWATSAKPSISNDF